MTPQERIARARVAQVAWASQTPRKRIAVLKSLRHIIAERSDEIIKVISAETGKTPMDALVADIMVTLEQLRFYEMQSARFLRPRKIARSRLFFRGTCFMETPEPYGVVLICAPWNYPLQLAVIPMATALFAGNAVLLKCSEQVPRTAGLIRDLCAAANLPPDLIQISTEGPDQASELVAAGLDLIFFTGSSRNGREVAMKAAELMIPTVMELGGKDPAIVLESCDLVRSVNGIVYGCFSNAGQVCVGTKRIYVQESIYDAFVCTFLDRIAALRIGTSMDSDFGPIRAESVRHQVRLHLVDAVSRGAIVLTPPALDNDALTPIVLANVPPHASVLLEESFGPIVSINRFATEPEAMKLANDSTFSLSASIWTRDMKQARRIARDLSCGSCAVNDVIRNIGNPHAAFGGNKQSGSGRYHGIEGLRTFSRIKSVMTTSGRGATEVHWFPFTTRTFKQLRAILRFRHVLGLRNRLRNLAVLWREQS